MSQRVLSAAGMKQAAYRRLPKMMFDFLEGGVLDEVTAARNLEAMRSVTYRQRAFPDVAHMDLSSSMLGQKTEVPFFIGPMGMLGMIHPDADPGIARAITDMGGIFIHSAWSGVALPEVVAAAAPGRVWAQAQFWKERRHTERHLAEAQDLGIDVLVLPGDCTVGEDREREMQHGMTRLPPALSLPDIVSCAMHPRWVAGVLFGGRKATYGNYQPEGRPLRMSEMKPFMKANKDLTVSWKDVQKTRQQWPGKLVIKGIMCAEDARIAIELGADAVYVSNLGGRQFDRGAATIDVLDEVVAEVNGQVEVYCDGGVHRGSDVLNVLSRGAQAAGIGRAAAYALAAGGGNAAAQLLATIRSELQIAMGFCGVNTIGDINPSVRREALPEKAAAL
ncbi:alpha-hydroxy acid oxidase [Paenarthrobacter nicotinovorans]|uniref:alpha-hydroxy acid oxidase n=1 Tax=Paenarthrobacter nicotinovorans TaxID=29320 RepID=UPI0038135376